MLDENTCPKCGAPLSEVTETPTGRKLRRCSSGYWDKEAKKNVGCDYVLWMPFEPKELDEKCPKCGSPLIMQMTRFGKKMKKCSTGGWDAKEKKGDRL
jgi:ssDNA-binding Zn-finger/Zn-ribbon topoisomerase 1